MEKGRGKLLFPPPKIASIIVVTGLLKREGETEGEREGAEERAMGRYERDTISKEQGGREGEME